MKSYLFKSTTEKVCRVKDTDDIQKTFSGIESDGIDPTTLTKLESILSGEDYYNICVDNNYTIFHRFNDEEGPVFINSSSQLIQHLKNLNKQQKSNILEKWCKTQEMALYGWTPKSAEFIIDWLLETCESSQDPKEQIILFVDADQNFNSIT
ncbi:MAG: hypothetical protein NE330_06030 [Lentisphaeraceae bacterium]|nr:hypothetical protein [Lentisphaeraceae bacterium]